METYPPIFQHSVRGRLATIFIAAINISILLLAVNAQAAFQLIENFDTLEIGDINGQNGWLTTNHIGEVVQDPVDPSNKSLKVSTESGILRKETVIAHGASRMLFTRFRFNDHGEFSFGLSHLPNAYEHSDFGPEVGMASSTANDPANELRVANALSDGTYDILKTLIPNTWYNIWILINNTSGSYTYQLWLNSIPGGKAQAGDQLKNSEAEILFGFRTPTGKDLINFFINTGGGQSPIDGRFYLDDIYLEDSDGTNLNNPLAQKIYLPWLFLLLQDKDF